MSDHNPFEGYDPVRPVPPAEPRQVPAFSTHDLTVADVKAAVDADPELARRALDSERSGKARTTLLTYLEDIVTGLDQALDPSIPDPDANAAAATRQVSDPSSQNGPYETFGTAEQEVAARQAAVDDAPPAADDTES